MAMHRVKIYQARSGRFTGGLLPVLPDCRPDRAEPVRGGAGNRCYGKCRCIVTRFDMLFCCSIE